MFRFLETDIREEKKYEKRIQTSVDNAVNDLCYEVKFENRVKDKNIFFIKAKKYNTLVSGNPGDERIFTRVVAKKKIYQFN